MKIVKKLLFSCAVFAAVTMWSERSDADTIGPLFMGYCLFDTCCYPANPRSEQLGDNFYNPSMCHQEKINEWWSAFSMDVVAWDEGWGYYDHCNADKPLARFFHALYALQYSASSPSAPLMWGYQYAVANIEDPIPDCATFATATARTPWYDDWLELHYPFFYQSSASVVFRAGTVVHEARHMDEPCSHNAGSDCVTGASCDQAWDDGCAALEPAPGANQFEIVWLWDFFNDAINTNDAMRHHAVELANAELYSMFAEDPCFRIGPDGKAYQLPIPACENTGVLPDYGGPSLVRAEEFQLQECLTDFSVVRSAACNYPSYAGQKWRLDPVLDDFDEPEADGRVRIVADSSGSCLRLSLAPDEDGTTFPNGVTCDSVPWLTTIVMGSCSGREAEFYVTPWIVEDTSPGLKDPDAYRRWRIRPYLICRTVNGNDRMQYGDACLDANAAGDHVLRVFWCHDSPRQQFRATDWY